MKNFNVSVSAIVSKARPVKPEVGKNVSNPKKYDDHNGYINIVK